MENSGEKKTILLVDDNAIHITIAETMLKKDYNVKLAKSGKEAIDFFLRGEYPDLVLLDIVMPTMDGWETYHKLKAISLLKDLPIAFLTSVNEEGEENRAYEMGAVDYITKPYDKKDLLSRIKKYI
jgi:CheY-like chemotaxis protein